MGTDFSCHQCFAAAADARGRRQEIIRHLTSSMRRAGYVPPWLSDSNGEILVVKAL